MYRFFLIEHLNTLGKNNKIQNTYTSLTFNETTFLAHEITGKHKNSHL